MEKYKRSELIEIDGRTLEGGGQLVRNALCLSSLTGTPIRITNIRGNRSGGGGLKAQHLSSVNWLARACNAKVEGAEIKSKTLEFRPGVYPGDVSPAYTKQKLPGDRTVFECLINIGSAGSTALTLQAILPYILFAPPQLQKDCFVRLRLSGGTNASGSPSYEYITQVLLPTLESIGLPHITPTLDTRGWSTGRTSIGSFMLDIPIRSSNELPAFTLMPTVVPKKPRKPSHIDVTFLGPVTCHNHLRLVLQPAIQHFFGVRYSEAKDNVSITCEDSKHEKRLYLIMVARVDASEPSTEYRLGRDWLYDRKIRILERSVTEMAERVTLELFTEWMSGAWVDEHMRDQLVIFAALSSGTSRYWPGVDGDAEPREASLHAQTAQWVVQRMLKGGNDEDTSPDIERLAIQEAVDASCQQ